MMDTTHEFSSERDIANERSHAQNNDAATLPSVNSEPTPFIHSLCFLSFS